MNLTMLLEMTASAFGDRVGVQNGSDRLSYADLFDAAGRAALRLSASGAERMAVLDVNSLAVPIGIFAAGWAGVPFVPLNYRLTGSELDGLIERISPCYLVAEPTRVDGLSGRPGVTVVSRDRVRGGVPCRRRDRRRNPDGCRRHRRAALHQRNDG